MDTATAITTQVTPHRVGRISSCIALLLALPALGQESTEPGSGRVRLEEVVVTATKRSENLQDVAVAVTALTAQDIDARGFTNYADFVNTVPNMYMQDQGPGKTQIYIRGLVAQGGSGFP